MEQHQFKILIADASHQDFAQIICDEMESSAMARGTGIAKRSPDYIQQKMRDEQGRYRLYKKTGSGAGFCYIKELRSHGEYVANFRADHLFPAVPEERRPEQIKRKMVELSRTTYPEAKILG